MGMDRGGLGSDRPIIDIMPAGAAGIMQALLQAHERRLRALEEFVLNAGEANGVAVMHPEKPARVRMGNIIGAVAKDGGYTVRELTGKGRRSDIVWARHLAIYLCRLAVPEISLAAIGAMFDSSPWMVMHGIKSVREQAQTNSSRARTVAVWERQLTFKVRDQSNSINHETK